MPSHTTYALDGMHVHAADNSKQAAELVHEEGIACLLEKEVARPEVWTKLQNTNP